MQNHLRDALKIIQNIIIPETQDAKALIRQILVAPFILRIFCMLTTIGFDNQAMLKTDKIDNI